MYSLGLHAFKTSYNIFMSSFFINSLGEHLQLLLVLEGWRSGAPSDGVYEQLFAREIHGCARAFQALVPGLQENVKQNHQPPDL